MCPRSHENISSPQVVNLLIGLARLGGLVRFISGPVLMGFNNGAAVVIFISQLPNVLGFAMPGYEYNFQQYAHLLEVIWKDSDGASFLIGFTAFTLLWVCRIVAKNFPNQPLLSHLSTTNTLIVAVLSTIMAKYLVKAGHTGVVILRDVPKGLPGFSIPTRGVSSVSELGHMVGDCLPVALLAFMSLWSVARKYADIQRQKDVEPNQEAVAIGVTNVLSGFFGCFPTAARYDDA